ncbi:MAG TPA: septation protein A [Usitatibacter sp.]
MKLLFDFFPVILFFIAFEVAGIFVATAVAIAAAVAQIAWVLGRGRKVDPMQWVTFVIIVVFGSATLVLRDEMFIKWKPTVLYWIFSAAFFGGLAFRTNFVKTMLASAEIVLPEAVYTRLAIAWGTFFLVTGALNLWVAYNFPTDVWVKFKVFGGIGLMLAFIIAQAVWLARHIPDEPPKAQTPES